MHVEDQQNHDWYSNKELFEMLQKTNENLSDVSKKLDKFDGLQETVQCYRQEVKQYRTEVDTYKTIVIKHIAADQSSNATVKSIWEKTGYLVGIGGLILALIGTVLTISAI